ncbi:MAG TPA: hypothetical protein VJ724_05035, partial [Tahibacter sp.]|nr:hypothetical protein [Tahibacter sp.]
MRLFFFLSAALIAGTSAATAQSLPLEVSLIRDTNTAPDQYGSVPGAFRRIDDRVYFYASAPQTGRELFSTDGTPGGWRLEYDLVPGPMAGYPSPVALGRVGNRLIVTAMYRLWAYGNGTAVALTPPATFDDNTTPRRAMANVGGRMLVTSGNSFDPIWVTDGTPEGTYPQDTGHGFALPQRDGADCATNAGSLYTSNYPHSLVRNDGTVAGSAVIATLPTAATGVALAGRCWFLVGTEDGGTAVWGSDGTAQGTSEVLRVPGEPRERLVVMNGNLYVATRGANYRVRRYAPSDFAHPSLILDVPATGGSLVATRSAVLAFLGHDDGSASVHLGDGGANMRVIHTAPPGGPNLRSTPYVQGDTVIVLTSPLATRIDATTGAVTTMQSGRALSRTFAASLGDDVIGPGTDDQEVWISDGTDAGTRQLHALWPDNAHGIGPYATYRTRVV